MIHHQTENVQQLILRRYSPSVRLTSIMLSFFVLCLQHIRFLLHERLEKAVAKSPNDTVNILEGVISVVMIHGKGLQIYFSTALVFSCFEKTIAILRKSYRLMGGSLSFPREKLNVNSASSGRSTFSASSSHTIFSLNATYPQI